MAVLMMLEMTMDATLLLPMMAGCVIAYTVSRMRQSQSLYAVLNRRQVKLSEARKFEELKLAELIEPAHHNLPPSATLAEARDLFAHTRTRYHYVLDANGCFIGALSVHRMTEVLNRNPSLAEAAVCDFIDADFLLLPAASALSDAWDAFMRSPLDRIPVVDDVTHKLLLGVVTNRKLLELAKCLRM